MTDESRPDEEPTPAEERLLALLAFLRAESVRDDAAAVPAIMRHLRWQRTLRDAVRALGQLGGALADGIAVILGIPRRSRSVNR